MNPRWLKVPVFIAWICAALGTPASFAAEPDAPPVEMTKVPVQGTQALLAEVLRRVQGAPRKPFIVDGRVPPSLLTGAPLPSPLSYRLLLTLLAANGLAALETDAAILIAVDATIRTQAIPTISSVEEKRLDEEFVSLVYTPTQIKAIQLVPLLRPLLPQAGHLIAVPEKNSLLIVDRFGNVKRIVEIVRALERVKAPHVAPATAPATAPPAAASAE